MQKKVFNILSDRLRELRGDVSQNEFARKIGVKQQSYNLWEAGKTDPSSSSLRLIATICNVTSDWLLGLSENRQGVEKGFTVAENGTLVNGSNNQNIGVKNGAGEVGGDLSERVRALEKAVEEIYRKINL